MQLQIKYVGFWNGNHMFEVIRSTDLKHTHPVPLPAASTFPVNGHQTKQFLPSLRWYLEDYLQLPFGGYQQTAQKVEETIISWGKIVFESLFTGCARDWYQDAKREGLEQLHIKITSDSPEIMSWPWETLYSEDDGYLALRCQISRQLSSVSAPPCLSTLLPQESIHILYVIPRPYGEQDVSYNMLAKSLINFVKKKNIPVTVDVLRPPTFNQLRQVLYESPNYYHIVHFDGHGSYRGTVFTANEGFYLEPEGCLIFESDNGLPDPIDAKRIAQLLAEYKVPIMVMNACQSGMIDLNARDPFACVAAGLVKAGVLSVVAMGYSLYVSAAKEFIPAFYERLFYTGRMSESLRVGRGKMMQQPERDCITGRLPLQDWIVPVLYQQVSEESQILPIISQRLFKQSQIELPIESRVIGDYGLIGRASGILKLDRAALSQPQAGILIHGQTGIGKTTLVKGFLHWLRDTNGLREHVFWFDFQEIYSAEYIIKTLVMETIGYSAVSKPLDEMIEELILELYSKPYWIIWDNFELVSGIEGTQIQAHIIEKERGILLRLLRELCGGKTKILITSRANEKWLPIQNCYSLLMEGMVGEDLWEYCNAVVKDLGLTFDRNNQIYEKILSKLYGNPLAIRSILLRLQDCSASQILSELDSAFAGVDGDESTRRLQAAFHVFSGGFSERFFPILQVTSLYEDYVDIDYIASILDVSRYTVLKEDIIICYRRMENAGLCTKKQETIYWLHPSVKGYLLKHFPASRDIQEGFIYIMQCVAENLIKQPFHKIRSVYKLYLTNLYNAWDLAVSCRVDTSLAILNSLAYYNVETRQFARAYYIIEIIKKQGEYNHDVLVVASAYHEFGIIAQMQGKLVEAEEWYRKSLKISKEQNDLHWIAMLLHKLGTVAQMQYKSVETVENLFQEALEYFLKLDDESNAANTYYHLGVLSIKQWRLEEAKDRLEAALRCCENREDYYFAIQIYEQLGGIAVKQRNFLEAEKWYRQAINFGKQYDDEDVNAFVFFLYGDKRKEQGNNKEAEKWYKKALAIYEKQHDKTRCAGLYFALGQIAMDQGDFSEAEDWFRQSLDIFRIFDDEMYIAQILLELSVISDLKGDTEASKEQCESALFIFEQLEDLNGVACAYQRLSIILYGKKDFMEADKNCKKAKGIFAKIGDKYNIACTNQQLGRISYRQKNFDQAAKYYVEALKEFVNEDNSRKVKYSYRDFIMLFYSATIDEQKRLKKIWFENMPQEVSKKLAMEGEKWMNTRNNNQTNTMRTIIWLLANQDIEFEEFYQRYMGQIKLRNFLPDEFIENVMTIVELDPLWSNQVKRYQENIQTANTFGVLDFSDIGLLIASIYLLNTHIKFHRHSNGKWDFFIEHKSVDVELLEKIAMAIISFIKSKDGV